MRAVLSPLLCAGVQELLTVVLAALLNLSTLRANQPRIARQGLRVLLSANASLYEVVCARDDPPLAEVALLNMAAALLSNLASHSDNRTLLYRAELAGTAALDRLLEAPGSSSQLSDDLQSAESLLASRLNGGMVPTSAADRARGAGGGGSGRGCSGSNGTDSPPPPLAVPTRCASPLLGTTAGRAGRQAGRVTKPLSASLDSPLALAAALRPKAVFPLMSKGQAASTQRPLTAAGSGPAHGVMSPAPDSVTNSALQASHVLHGAHNQRAGYSPAPLLALRSPTMAGGGQPRTATTAQSPTSRAATSVMGAPGSSPRSGPDSREQFLIWLDATLADAGARGAGSSPEHSPGLCPGADGERR